jgi:hypothetical protein
MQKITDALVKKLNDEVTSDNFWDIVDKYHLETPEKYSHSKLCEQDGVEVWGETKDGDVLVYDCYNGFYILPKNKWIQEIRNIYEEEADTIFRELVIGEPSDPVCHEFRINGIEAIEKTVASGNKSSARVNVPPSWQGKRVILIRLE